MISQSKIQEVKDLLVNVYNPITIYIFGSYAWGTPTEDSDIDILVVVESSTEKSHRRPIIGRQAMFGLEISKDLLVYTKEEFESRLKDEMSLAYKVKNYGRVLYARA